MKSLYQIIIITCLLFIATSTNISYAQKPFSTGNTLFVDVRTPEEFRAGSVKSAMNIPLQELPASIDKLPRNKHIVVFCRSGNRSAQAMQYLRTAGYKDIEDGKTWIDVKQKWKL